jgi:hypothetical protein
MNNVENPKLTIPRVSGCFCFDFIHKLSGEKLRIKKLFGDVALCECETTTIITEKPYLDTNAAVCDIKNLIQKK